MSVSKLGQIGVPDCNAETFERKHWQECWGQICVHVASGTCGRGVAAQVQCLHPQAINLKSVPVACRQYNL
jgi:hypothetical protein